VKYVTEISVPDFGDGGIQRLIRNRLKEKEEKEMPRPNRKRRPSYGPPRSRPNGAGAGPGEQGARPAAGQGARPRSGAGPVSRPTAVVLPVSRAPGSGWQDRAACRSEPPEWFDAETDEDAARALAVCAGCRVRRECFAAAAADRAVSGVWGGVDLSALHRQAVAFMTRQTGRPGCSLPELHQALAAYLRSTASRPGAGTGGPGAGHAARDGGRVIGPGSRSASAGRQTT